MYLHVFRLHEMKRLLHFLPLAEKESTAAKSDLFKYISILYSQQTQPTCLVAIIFTLKFALFSWCPIDLNSISCWCPYYLNIPKSDLEKTQTKYSLVPSFCEISKEKDTVAIKGSCYNRLQS